MDYGVFPFGIVVGYQFQLVFGREVVNSRLSYSTNNNLVDVLVFEKRTATNVLGLLRTCAVIKSSAKIFSEKTASHTVWPNNF